MSLHGLDVNATRLRAASGLLGDYPYPELLASPHADLPLCVHFEGRTPAVGANGLRVCRKTPRAVLYGFLARVGEPVASGRRAQQTAPEPLKALKLIFQQVHRQCNRTDGTVLALPAYLTPHQVDLVLGVAGQAGISLLGSIAAPLAAALTAHAEQSWQGACLVIDADDHAATITTVSGQGGHAQILDSRTLPHLGLRNWRERLLNALSDCCILESRWDPRDCPEAEQGIFDQLDVVLESALAGRISKVTIQHGHRYQNLVLQPRDPVAFCSGLRHELLREIAGLLHAPWPDCAPSAILVTAAAAHLPGVVVALQQLAAEWVAPAGRAKQPRTSLEDFGSGLLDDAGSEALAVVILPPDAAARGAHSVGANFQRGDILRGHLPAAAPLPLPQPLEAGPARLHFQGQDFMLGVMPFTIGRQPGVDLLFDGEQWPHVSARHCEIIFDRRAHLLRDRSRDGTLVNDLQATDAVQLRPGDWIRLGPAGPLLRFLGQSVDLRTTA
jgi:FHA domain